MALACWQTPADIRHAGAERVTKLLRRGKIRNAGEIAEAVLAAAHQQAVTLPGQRAAALVVRELATEILTLHQRVEAIDASIAGHLAHHPLAPIVQSLPGMGQVLTAELLVHTANMSEWALVRDHKTYKPPKAVSPLTAPATIGARSSLTNV